MKNNLSKVFHEKIKKLVYKILSNENLLQSEFHLGKIDTIINSKSVKCFIDGGSVSLTIPCNPDVTFHAGDEVIVIFINNSPLNKYVISRRVF